MVFFFLFLVTVKIAPERGWVYSLPSLFRKILTERQLYLYPAGGSVTPDYNGSIIVASY
jgi:hypothetical protein